MDNKHCNKHHNFLIINHSVSQKQTNVTSVYNIVIINHCCASATPQQIFRSEDADHQPCPLRTSASSLLRLLCRCLLLLLLPDFYELHLSTGGVSTHFTNTHDTVKLHRVATIQCSEK